MENAASALQMAAFMLIFVLALSISINAFGEASQTSQTILNYKDREYDYDYIDGDSQRERIVGAEAIIPAIYRSYKENYKIVFKENENKPMTIYRKNSDVNIGEQIDVNSIDLEKDVVGDNTKKEKFIERLLYGGTETFTGITFNTKSLYEEIKNAKFKEELGVYYREELNSSDTQSNIPDTNRDKKRVITYTKIST